MIQAEEKTVGTAVAQLFLSFMPRYEISFMELEADLLQCACTGAKHVEEPCRLHCGMRRRQFSLYW